VYDLVAPVMLSRRAAAGRDGDMAAREDGVWSPCANVLFALRGARNSTCC
jgi:hypothetical protein